MDTRMTLTFPQIKQITPQLLMAGIDLDDITKSDPLSVELIGPSGVGKSQFVRQCVDMMSERTGEEWGFSRLNCTTALSVTVPGFPLFSKANERGTRTTEHTEPVWMTCMNGKSVFEYKRGILFLDERRSADPDIKKQLADLILDLRSGNHRLPPGWVVWSAGNRTNDRSGVTKDYDFIINRHLEIHIRVEIEALADYYAQINVLPVIIAFALQNPQCVIHDGAPDIQGPWCTPRSLEMAGNLLKQFVDPANPEKINYSPVVLTLVAGLVGEGVAHQLGAFLKMANSAIQYADIVKDPLKTLIPEKPDMQMLVTYSAAMRCDKDTLTNVIKYVQRMPEEYAVMFSRAALKRNPKFINHAALMGWCAQNATLMSTVSNLG